MKMITSELAILHQKHGGIRIVKVRRIGGVHASERRDRAQIGAALTTVAFRTLIVLIRLGCCGVLFVRIGPHMSTRTHPLRL